MDIVVAKPEAVKTKRDARAMDLFGVELPNGVEWPVLIESKLIPGGCVQLMEWPTSTQERGRYIVRRILAGKLTERKTTDSLGDAQALLWHLSQPLPTQGTVVRIVECWAMVGETDGDDLEMSVDANGQFGHVREQA